MKNEEQKKIIKDICIEFGCTQIELASKIGVDTVTVNRWSNGTRKIPNYFYKSIECMREVKLLKYNN
jgi:transcriptional regulator with XRE-family HTH domain